MIFVKISNIDTGKVSIHSIFSASHRAEAAQLALQINCKPFTPFYAWLEG